MNMGFFSFFRDKISRHERKHLKYFEKKLGYVFSNKRLLRRALSHKSYANEKRLGATHHNERYEYLGDAVLELAVSDVLMHLFPELSMKLRLPNWHEKFLWVILCFWAAGKTMGREDKKIPSCPMLSRLFLEPFIWMEDLSLLLRW